MIEFDLMARASTKDKELVDKLILEWNSPANNGKYLLLVESNNDKQFYYKFFDHKTVAIRQTEGCNLMRKVLNKMDSTNITYFAIKDSDFDRVSKINPSNSNCFLTDCHDHEMMCLHEKEVMTQLFRNNMVEYEEKIVDSIFEELKVLSHLKWYNYCNHCNLNFNRFYPDQEDIDKLKSFDYIINKIEPQLDDSESAHSFSEHDVSSFIDTQDIYDQFEITNGHDFLRRLIVYFHSVGCKSINHNIIRVQLYSLFNFSHFKNTQLYQEIFKWGQGKQNVFYNSL